MAPVLQPPVAPQLARPRAALPEGDGWAYEPKLDGFRAVVFVDGADVHLQSRNGKPLTRYFPELEFPAGRYVLDGEIVASSFDTLGQRIHPAKSRVDRLAAETPAHYVAFDLLADGDEVLLDLPYRERRARLEAFDLGAAHLAPMVASAEEAAGWLHSEEGVIAKEVDAPYRPGERAGMVKIKRVRTIDAVVLGWRPGKEEATVGSFLRSAGIAGLGAVGTATVFGSGVLPASAAPAKAPSDAAILNFALNLEYLEAEFYQRAAFGHRPVERPTSTARATSGERDRRDPQGQRSRPGSAVEQYARWRSRHGRAGARASSCGLSPRPAPKVVPSRPSNFTDAASRVPRVAAGVINSQGQTFDPFANENNFLLAAFLFEDVGVTAYKGAAPLIDNKTYLEAAAGILAVEAYHAGVIRSAIYQRGTTLRDAARKISDARDSLDGRSDDDQGPGSHVYANLTPTDGNGIAYSRTAANVLNVVYLTNESRRKGGFFPNGVNGEINRSNDND